MRVCLHARVWVCVNATEHVGRASLSSAGCWSTIGRGWAEWRSGGGISRCEGGQNTRVHTDAAEQKHK